MSVILDDNDRGTLMVEGNETMMTSKVVEGDAAKFRVRAPVVPGQSGGGGAYSWDVRDHVDDKWKEVQLITGAMNGARGGEGKLIVLMEGGVIDDAHQKTVIEWDSTKVEFKVPISAPGLGVGGGGMVNRLYSGRFVYQLQDDPPSGPLGRIVVYATHGTLDESQWTAVGVLTPTPL